MLGDVELAFGDMVERATGGAVPYPYQTALAVQGLPELLEVPTGSGKTLAAVLPWLFRRRFHPGAGVRAATPHWLVFVLPMRVLVEQTTASVQRWIAELGLADQVGVHVVMGGEGRLDSAWRAEPERDAVFVGTLDMLVSRALNRGYGESRFAWPIDFGLFNSGCQWVYDEVQLMGAALPTSRQLQGLRERLGNAAPSYSMWMSATVDRSALETVDNPDLASSVALTGADRIGPLERRLDATRTVEVVDHCDDQKQYAAAIARAIAGAHNTGTLSLAVLNTVDRAVMVYKALRGLTDVEVVLLHSRFRPQDRQAHVAAALAAVDNAGPGRVVVSTQVIEAGVDISARVLFTEAAPWPSIVQRAGRCNRDGSAEDARLLWASPPNAAPYPDADVDAGVEALRGLEGRAVTSTELSEREVLTTPEQHEVLRRRDLVELFDTTPDLSGNDVDVSRFIRVGDDVDLQIAWRSIAAEGPTPEEAPTSAELCPVPVGSARGFAKRHGLWRFDHLAPRRWVRARSDDIRPGAILVASHADGGYLPELGWDASSSSQVPMMAGAEHSPLMPAVEATGDDELTTAPQTWVALRDHLADAEHDLRRLASELDLPGLSDAQLEAARAAALLHDIGKAHPVFQETLRRSCEGGSAPPGAGPWAKSGAFRMARHERRYFRHELVSSLMLLGDAREVLDDFAERDLVTYLVAAHHGRVRLGIRSLPDEGGAKVGPDTRIALGVIDGDEVDAVEIPTGTLPRCVLDLGWMELGDRPDGSPSWGQRMLGLRDREDLGPFRLGYLEALVRLADWRSSARPGGAG